MKRLSLPLSLMVLSATCGASAAQERCPLATDLETGIQLTQTDPLITSTIRLVDGVYHETRIDTSRPDLQVRHMTRTHYLLPPSETGSRTLTVQMDVDPTLLDQLPTLGQVAVDVVMIEPDRQPTDVALTITYEGAGEVRIGPCDYPVWTVRMDQTFTGATYVAELTYAHTLGIIVGLETSSQRFEYDAIKIDG